MHNDLNPAAPPDTADPVAPPVAADQPPADGPRYPRVAALLTTTALLTAMDPKLPPYKGD